MTRGQLFNGVIACYPRWWRDVYGREVRSLTDDLLADGHRPGRLAVNLLWGAAATHLWARGMPMRPDLWAARSRVSIAAATLPWLVVLPFVVVGLHASTLYQVFHGHDSLRRAQAIANQTGMHVSGYLSDVVGYGVMIGMIAAIVGWSALSQATSAHRRAQRLVNVPLYFLPVLVGLYVGWSLELNRAWASHGIGPPIPMHPNGPLAVPLLVALWAVFVAALVATSAGLVAVARREDIPLRTIKRGRQVATVIALALCCMTVSAVVSAVLSSRYGVVQAVGYSSVTFHIVAATVTIRRYDWSFLAGPLAVAAAVSTAGWLESRKALRKLASFYFRS